MPTSKFSELYQKLNPEQKQAVDEIEGPVMVVAGPGTGKTYVLTLRIANILRETDTRPENILVLTFTESAAAAMRRRLVEIIASPAYQVEINTFHGFCNEIIKSYPEEFSEVISRQNITEVDQINIIEL
ncbi:UvrD-helicase domain-containing protein, partial [Patescibacteria group bacterium]|nr:UvrD-helicase domain-containing protein [Patescibacteria group bacterium]